MRENTLAKQIHKNKKLNLFVAKEKLCRKRDAKRKREKSGN